MEIYKDVLKYVTQFGTWILAQAGEHPNSGLPGYIPPPSNPQYPN